MTLNKNLVGMLKAKISAISEKYKAKVKVEDYTKTHGNDSYTETSYSLFSKKIISVIEYADSFKVRILEDRYVIETDDAFGLLGKAIEKKVADAFKETLKNTKKINGFYITSYENSGGCFTYRVFSSAKDDCLGYTTICQRSSGYISAQVTSGLELDTTIKLMDTCKQIIKYHKEKYLASSK